MDRNYDKVFLHVDLDAFFASVEQRDNPQYRGKPVIIGGLPEDRRAVVSTASYEARKYGVHSAMPIAQAARLCPNGIYIRGNYHHYSQVSHEIMAIFNDFSPSVLQMSIDEAFIDVTGTQNIWGSPVEAAQKIKDRVKSETGLTVSVGVASTMYVAKIASGFRKPDGLTYIPAGDEEKFMLSLPLEKLWGAGTKTQERLHSAGFRTTRDIHSKSISLLKTIFGESMGSFLYNAVRGNKDMEFGREAKNKSMSEETTFEYDVHDRYTIGSVIMVISKNILWRMHQEKLCSRTCSVKIRYDDFSTVSIQETSEINIANSDDLYERCIRLFEKKYDDKKSIRLIGISVEKLESTSIPQQETLFDFGNKKKSKVEKAIFDMESRNPALKMKKARLLKD